MVYVQGSRDVLDGGRLMGSAQFVDGADHLQKGLVHALAQMALDLSAEITAAHAPHDAGHGAFDGADRVFVAHRVFSRRFPVGAYRIGSAGNGF